MSAAASSLTSEGAAVGSQGTTSSSSRGASKDHSAVQFEICRIPGDGSCLFRALAQGLHQLETGQDRLLPSAWLNCLPGNSAGKRRQRHI